MNIRQLGCLIVLFLLAGPKPAGAEEGKLQFASLGSCEVETEGRIDDCSLGYRTFGQLNAERSNAVLFPAWFRGRTKDMIDLIGPEKLIDSSRYFVIAVDAFGNGVSSSPSNSGNQPGQFFPQFTIRDMVQAQRRLVTEHLGLSHLRAVVGISMGGMQAFEWAVTYPAFMDKVVSIVGSPKLTSYDLLLWTAELRAIEQVLDCGCGQEAALPIVSAIHTLALTTPEYRVRRTSPTEFADFAKAMDEDFRQYFRLHDYASQLRAMMTHDVSAGYGGDLREAAAQIESTVLVAVADRDHMVNPTSSLEFATYVGARVVHLSSPCGHLTILCETEKLEQVVSSFLRE